jgi:CubicO group peptidase (beta-lactamase class C family)
MDRTFQHVVDFGLGFLVDSNRYGANTVPYGFGLHCSPRTFGHGGAQSSMGFADPEHGLVVAWAANALIGEPRHNARNRAINTAIYEDLRLACDWYRTVTGTAMSAG